MANKIKVILWDIDGTILNFKEAEKAAIRRGFKEHGLGECTDSMLEDYSSINVRYWKYLEQGEMTKPEILVGRFREFFSKYGIPAEKADAFNADYQVNLGDTICYNDNAPVILDAIPEGIGQFIVTNGTAIAQHKKLNASGLKQRMDGYFISDEVGFEKPSIEYFNIVLKHVRDNYGPVSNEEIMIIGDSLTSDMQGGNNAGLVCCWYNPDNVPLPENLRIDYNIRNLSEVLQIINA